MGKYISLGQTGQIKHPYIRGRLSSRHEASRGGKVIKIEDYMRKTDETYFVPSFSIRRHLDIHEESSWTATQQHLQRRLGRSFTVATPEDISIKAIEQHRFINNMHQAGIHPDPNEIRDIAYSIRDQLTNLLANAHSPLAIPFGNLARYGYKSNALAYSIEGWRGDRAHYGENDYDGYMDSLSVLQAERRLAVGALTLAYGEYGLDTDGIAPSPHATIARSKDTIQDFELHGLRSKLAGIVLDGALFGDPVIDVKLYRDEPSEPIYVKHAWSSLAIAAQVS